MDNVKFAACKHLSFDRSKFVPETKMNLISHFRETKVTWDRIDVDGNHRLVQFCTLRGRLNCATACLNDKESYVCSLYEEAIHIVPLSDIDTEEREPMDAKQLLENLTEAYALRDLLSIEKARAVPEDVKKVLADIDAEFAPKLETVEATIADLEAKAKAAVIEAGATVRGGALQAVYAKGRVSWNSEKLDGLALMFPELKQARTEGKPSVSIRKAG